MSQDLRKEDLSLRRSLRVGLAQRLRTGDSNPSVSGDYVANASPQRSCSPLGAS